MKAPIENHVWQRLMAPINESQPTGVNSRDDVSANALYQQLRDARTLARNHERAKLAEAETDYFSYAEWAIVLDKAPQLLAQESKDLEVIAWYIEALTRHYGFIGVAAGFQLATEIIAKFGQQVYPPADEDGISSQLSALMGLNGFGAEGTLIGPIKSIVITQGEQPGPLATWQCDQAYQVNRINDTARRTARLKQGALNKSEIELVASQTSTQFFRQTLRDLQAAIDSFDRFQTIVNTFSSDKPQPTAAIEQALANCQQTLLYLAGPRLRSAEPPATNLPPMAQKTALGTELAGTSGEALTRPQAIAQLAQIAAFFRLSEPHSPISYSLEQTIRWSELTLTELINQLIPDEPAQNKFKRLTGIEEHKE